MTDIVAPDVALDDSETGTRRRIISRLITPAAGIAAVDVVAILLFGLLTPNHVFFAPLTFTTVALGAAQVVLLGMGASFLLGASEFDLSLGSNVILSSVVGALVMRNLAPAGLEVSILFGILACIACGITYGLLNGLVVTRLNVNALIGTLGTLGIGTGFAFALSGGVDVLVPGELQDAFGIRTVLGFVPVPTLTTAAFLVVGYVMLTQTRFGVMTLAAGSSREAAIRSGLPVKFHLVRLFVMAGLLAGVSAVMDISHYTTTSVASHQTDSLAAIAGSVIGGTSLFGGRVSLIGMVFGCLLPVILSVGLVQLGLQPFYQLVAVGVVLIVAVAIRSRDPDAPRRQLHRRLLHFWRSG